MEYQAIENYAAIGNMKTVALDWKRRLNRFFLCFPNFDSPSIFAALLDPDKGGYFCIRPEAGWEDIPSSFICPIPILC